MISTNFPLESFHLLVIPTYSQLLWIKREDLGYPGVSGGLHVIPGVVVFGGYSWFVTGSLGPMANR